MWQAANAASTWSRVLHPARPRLPSDLDLSFDRDVNGRSGHQSVTPPKQHQHEQNHRGYARSDQD